MTTRRPGLTALSIFADRELAGQVAASVEATGVFQILSQFHSYPSQQALEIRLRQAKPEVILLDLATDLSLACELIRSVSSLNSHIHVVGVHSRNDSDAVLRSLRMGASEFLYAPFEAQVQNEAAARLRRLMEPGTAEEVQPGTIVAFASAKPGSGASTLAAQTAFALRRASAKRILLADFDLTGGMIAFYLKLTNTKSLLDLLDSADKLNENVWSSMISAADGLDVLPAPEIPYAGPVEGARLHAVLEYARLHYDWIIIDLPLVFQRLSLMTISESNRAFLVTTSELPSLHLARKAVTLLEQLGFPKERFQIMMNRIGRRDDLAASDMQRLFNCAVDARIPNDYFSLHRAVTLGQPVDSHCELGKAVEGLARRLAGHAAGARHRTVPEWNAAPSAV